MGTKRRRGRAFWEQMVAEYRSSGLTQKEFSQRRGVALSSLARWARTLPVAVPPRFVEVVAAPRARPARGSVRVRLGDVVIEFDETPSYEGLGELLRAARGT